VEPESPDAAKTVWSWAAAWVNNVASNCCSAWLMPLAPSHSPQLVVSTLAVSSSTIRA
jgi:hypothetical protein